MLFYSLSFKYPALVGTLCQVREATECLSFFFYTVSKVLRGNISKQMRARDFPRNVSFVLMVSKQQKYTNCAINVWRTLWNCGNNKGERHEFWNSLEKMKCGIFFFLSFFLFFFFSFFNDSILSIERWNSMEKHVYEKPIGHLCIDLCIDNIFNEQTWLPIVSPSQLLEWLEIKWKMEWTNLLDKNIFHECIVI